MSLIILNDNHLPTIVYCPKWWSPVHNYFGALLLNDTPRITRRGDAL